MVPITVLYFNLRIPDLFFFVRNYICWFVSWFPNTCGWTHPELNYNNFFIITFYGYPLPEHQHDWIGPLGHWLNLLHWCYSHVFSITSPPYKCGFSFNFHLCLITCRRNYLSSCSWVMHERLCLKLETCKWLKPVFTLKVFITWILCTKLYTPLNSDIKILIFTNLNETLFGDRVFKKLS